MNFQPLHETSANFKNDQSIREDILIYAEAYEEDDALEVYEML